MIDRRKFVAACVSTVVGIKASAPALQGPVDGAQVASAQVSEVTGHSDEVELMLDSLFGKNRNKPTPLPTIEHLDPAELCYVVFTDAHMGPANIKRWNTQNIYNWRTEEAIRQINALQPEFALHLGDSIWGEDVFHPDPNTKLYQDAARQAAAIFGKLKCRFYNTPGTHDFGAHHRPTRDPATVAQMEQATTVFKTYFGDIYYSFEAKGCTFIVFNNALANVESPEADKQMEWLKQELAKAASSKFRFFASHEPFFLEAPDEDPGNSMNAYLQPARVELLELLNSHGFSVVYSGHLYFSIANEYKNLYLCGLNSCAQNRWFLAESGTPMPFPTEAQIDDPYKVGYLVVRIRSGQIHESWVSTYWRVPEPPVELAALSGTRLVARPATEMEDSILGTVSTPPTPVVYPGKPTEKLTNDFGSMVNDHWWRSGENVGSKWLQVWPIPENAEEWSNLERGLTLGRPQGMKIAMPLPSESIDMGETWSRLEPHKSAIDAVVVCNGGPIMFNCPTMYNPQLVTWNTKEAPEEWAAACKEARKLVPEKTKIILGRITLRSINGETYSTIKHSPLHPIDRWYHLPYPSDVGVPGSGLEPLRKAAAALSGSADGIAAWFKTAGPPEEYADEIAAAAQIARSHGLELWLDAVGWDYVAEPLRSAYFLRLLALCQANGARLFWWNGPSSRAGLLDGFYDPTAMYYAAQAWQTFADVPAEPVKLESLKIGDIVKLQWKDRRGRSYAAWWQASNHWNVQMGWKGMNFPSNAIAADPLHGRLLKLDPAHGLPLCSWPLIVRSA